MNLNIPGLQVGQPTEDDIRTQLASQAPSFGGFLGNIASDAGSIVSGIPSLLQSAYNTSPLSMIPNAIASTMKSGNPVQGVADAAMAPGKTAFDIGKGLVNEAGQLTGIGQNGQVFDPQEVVSHAYNHPLNTLLDVLPLAKIGELGNMGKTAEAAPLTDASSTPSVATKMYSSAFGVTPTQAKYLRPLDTFNEMIQHGVSGGYKDIQNTINKVTGANGALPKMVRQAVGAIPGEINISDLPGILNDQLSQIPGLTDRNIEAHLTAVHKILKTGQSDAIGAIAPLDSLDAIKSFQAKAAEYFHKPYSELNHALGDVYSTAANELRDRLDVAANQSNVVAPHADQIIGELNKISPRLGQQFAANPTVGTLRSIQAPFVRMGQILESTAAGGTSKSAQLVGALNRAILGGAGFATGGLPGAVGAQFIAPVASAGIEAVLPKVMTSLGTATANAGNAADAVKGASLPSLELGRIPSLGAATDSASAAPSFSGTPALASTTSTNNQPQWQVSADGQYKTDPSTGQSYSMDEQWVYDPNQKQWVPNQASQQQGQNGLPSISDIEAAMVNDMRTTGGVQMDRLNALLQAAEYQQSQYGGEVQAGTIATKNANAVAQQAAQMFLGAGANPQTGLGGTGGLVNTNGGTGFITGNLRQAAIALGGKNLDSNAANYNTWADNAAIQIAAALNGGYDKVTAENKKAALSLLPRLTDSPQSAATKINQIMQYLQQAQGNYYGSTPAQLQQQSQGLPPVNQFLGGQ